CRQIRCGARFRRAPDSGSCHPGRCQRKRRRGWKVLQGEEAKNPIHLSSRCSEAHVGAPAANEKAAVYRGLLFFPALRSNRVLSLADRRHHGILGLDTAVGAKPYLVGSTSYFAPFRTTFLNVETNTVSRSAETWRRP
ncbi:MAG TPA: hypothetical protein VES94_07360, partial [Burkholderiales bacterium]|nr:hypothetical protein [Burkholderiales bacterium]